MSSDSNTFQAVQDLASKLMDAAQAENQVAFDGFYLELKAICLENENTNKDHPVQWETLADFTEDYAEAIAGYQKALNKAIAVNSKEYMASIAYSMATMQVELGQSSAAMESLKKAKASASKLSDKVLKREIDTLIETLATN
ncbi:tetratricopeptide repeat protein [Alginatibacterium sediminis]|uniref:Tetratricopeptide repeat protein n=1 Tax=Alginatibacterium sediminis TaxID=2164068 RepID=A0A420EGZ0_9ALTE|nr:tetratricopeptide repeat protein [Alginatibacterium sediminis]RKF19982.1 tetratricopeptide repeat protein [Alginatibacterium sediminis]